MGVEFVRMLTAAQRHQLVFNCPLCSLLRIGVVGVDIGISGFGSRSRLSGILPEHFGQFDASFRDGGTPWADDGSATARCPADAARPPAVHRQ